MTSQIEDIWLNDGTQDLHDKFTQLQSIKSPTLRNL